MTPLEGYQCFKLSPSPKVERGVPHKVCRLHPNAVGARICDGSSCLGGARFTGDQSTNLFGYPPPLFSGSRKRGVEFRGGSRHDRNRHNRRNRQNRQNRHGCLLALYFAGEVGKALSRTAKTVKTAKTVMKATRLNSTPLFRHPDFLSGTHFNLQNVNWHLGIPVPPREYEIPPAPKIPENYSKSTIWPTTGLS